MPYLVQSVVSAYKITLARGSCCSKPLQTAISSGLDDCSGSVWSPDLLLPCWKGKKKGGGWGWGWDFLLESVGENTKDNNRSRLCKGRLYPKG